VGNTLSKPITGKPTRWCTTNKGNPITPRLFTATLPSTALGHVRNLVGNFLLRTLNIQSKELSLDHAQKQSASERRFCCEEN